MANCLQKTGKHGMINNGLPTNGRLTHSVPTTIHVFQGLPHGFRRFGERLSACQVWDKVIEDGVRLALKRPPPSTEYKIQVH